MRMDVALLVQHVLFPANPRVPSMADACMALRFPKHLKMKTVPLQGRFANFVDVMRWTATGMAGLMAVAVSTAVNAKLIGALLSC